MTTGWKTLTVAAMMFAGVGMAQAGMPGCMEGCADGDGPQNTGRHIKKMSRELGLSTAQSAQVKAIFEKDREQVKPLTEKLRAERKVMHDLIHGDSVDEAAIRAQSAKLAAIQVEMELNRARMFQQLRPILTPEQLQKIKEMPDRQAGRMGKHPGRGPAAMGTK